MEHDFWKGKWDAGQIGFHQADVSVQLRRHADVAWTRHGTVLVPLCGKTLDLAWLETRFERVIGVEFVRQAVDELFAERGVTPTVTSDAGVTVVSHGRLTVRVQDFLTVEPAQLGGPVDAVWDRAALIALPPDVRPRYADRLVALMATGASCLLVTIIYPQEVMPGPPFSVGDDEVLSLFSRDVSVRRLEHSSVTDRRPAMMPADAPISSSTWLITRT